jgi:hypothetical protein
LHRIAGQRLAATSGALHAAQHYSERISLSPPDFNESGFGSRALAAISFIGALPVHAIAVVAGLCPNDVRLSDIERSRMK